MARTPNVIAVAGPNGAGKSTSGPALVRDALGVTEFVDADLIARGLSAFEPDRAALAAGRVMLARMRDLARQRRSFAFETTLAARSFAPWIRRLLDDGYAFHLIYLWLPAPGLAVSRVADRVSLGGHDVPAAVVRRRYHSGLRNLLDLYLPLAETWRVYDNSGDRPRPVASGSKRETSTVADPRVWSRIRKRYGP